jgi:hypothetical protein
VNFVVYFGGRCDIYGYGKFENVFYYDFTSLYPAMGAKHITRLEILYVSKDGTLILKLSMVSFAAKSQQTRIPYLFTVTSIKENWYSPITTKRK